MTLSFSGFYVLLAVSLAVSLMIIKASASDKQTALLIGVTTSIQIKVMNFIYKKIAEKFTNWENWKT